MGCGGSKEGVAAGNTASFRRILTRKSDSSNTKTTQDFSATFPELDAIKPEHHVPNDAPVAASKEEDVELKKREEHVVKVEKKEEEVVVEKGKEITKESPDQYFSSRKDEEMVVPKEGAGEGLEYYSPLPEANNVGEKVEEVEVKEEDKKENDGALEEPLKEEIIENGEDSPKEEAELKEEKELVIGDAEEVAASNDKDGKAVEQDQAEAVLVEEAKSEEAKPEKAKPEEIIEEHDSREERNETNSLAE